MLEGDEGDKLYDNYGNTQAIAGAWRLAGAAVAQRFSTRTMLREVRVQSQIPSKYDQNVSGFEILTAVLLRKRTKNH